MTAEPAQVSPTPPRRASLVLVTPDGRVLGRLQEIPVATEWWPDIAAVVEAAHERFGIEVVVLRMLDSELPRPHGGLVTYLAEVTEAAVAASPVDLLPFEGTLDDQPLRLRWAEPGGPAGDLAWADEVLRDRHIERDGPAQQVRSWNLSSIWRLPLASGGSAWLKVVPPFFAHEGAMLRRLQGGPVPRLIGHDGDRILLAEIPGPDRYGAVETDLIEMVSTLVSLQVAWIGRTHDLLGIGLPDWRWPALSVLIEDVVGRRSGVLGGAERRTLGAFIDGLPARLAIIDDSGLPDTLVHGDFHPGNVRGAPGRLVLLDWGDCGIGHPLLDLSAFFEVLPADSIEPVRRHWLDAWRRAVPGCDPDRALVLLEPVAAARQAAIYQMFLDNIEPVERRHHDADVVAWLRRAAALAAQSQ